MNINPAALTFWILVTCVGYIAASFTGGDPLTGAVIGLGIGTGISVLVDWITK